MDLDVPAAAREGQTRYPWIYAWYFDQSASIRDYGVRYIGETRAGNLASRWRTERGNFLRRDFWLFDPGLAAEHRQAVLFAVASSALPMTLVSAPVASAAGLFADGNAIGEAFEMMRFCVGYINTPLKAQATQVRREAEALLILSVNQQYVHHAAGISGFAAESVPCWGNVRYFREFRAARPSPPNTCVGGMTRLPSHEYAVEAIQSCSDSIPRVLLRPFQFRHDTRTIEFVSTV